MDDPTFYGNQNGFDADAQSEEFRRSKLLPNSSMNKTQNVLEDLLNSASPRDQPDDDDTMSHDDGQPPSPPDHITLLCAENLAQVYISLNKALSQVHEEVGIKFSYGNLAFTNKGMSLRLTGAVTGFDFEAEEERQKQAFENQAHNYGLEADDFRRTVSDGTRRYRLDEFEHAPGKHSIIAKNLAGWHISTKQVQKTDGEYNFVGGGNVPGEHPYHK